MARRATALICALSARSARVRVSANLPETRRLLHPPPLLCDLEVRREPDVGKPFMYVKSSSSSAMRGWRPMQNGCTTSRKHPPTAYEPSNSAFHISSTCEGVERPDMYGKKLNRK